MKSLKEFIKESIESGNTNAKFFNLDLSKFKKSISKVISAANKDGLYFEYTDYDCKIKIYKTSKVSSIVHALNSIIENNKSNKELYYDVEYLSNKLQKIIDFTAFKEDDADSDNGDSNDADSNDADSDDTEDGEEE